MLKAHDEEIPHTTNKIHLSPLYDKAAEMGLVDELAWGGNWKRFKDKPHYQPATGLVLAGVRD